MYTGGYHNIALGHKKWYLPQIRETYILFNISVLSSAYFASTLQS